MFGVSYSPLHWWCIIQDDRATPVSLLVDYSTPGLRTELEVMFSAKLTNFICGSFNKASIWVYYVNVYQS